jgi:hypothetical protein
VISNPRSVVHLAGVFAGRCETNACVVASATGSKPTSSATHPADVLNRISRAGSRSVANKGRLIVFAVLSGIMAQTPQAPLA